MSDTDDAIQQLQATIDALRQSVDAAANRQTNEIAVLFAAASLIFAELPPETRSLIEDSFSDWAGSLPNPSLTAGMKQIAQQRLGMHF
ncbi:hypothetical protein [Burkholderia stagnalis]|uniref:hypothetical protein n=1 Tax=Burkholderia stagnalis TaxID=1503054 RepID=UPI000F5C1EC3|nr:hypothetical protein [Burkholderia stagnalis]RQQ00428.1 hypothetical protein DF164_29795 [Burkholderia stagnalis]RQY68662.1 hypothetical protein DF110_19110 [Burkholderia stagnalis]